MKTEKTDEKRQQVMFNTLCRKQKNIKISKNEKELNRWFKHTEDTVTVSQ